LNRVIDPQGQRSLSAELFQTFLIAVDHAITAFDAVIAVKIPSGVCGSLQKLTS
jgi:hypothetical protein